MDCWLSLPVGECATSLFKEGQEAPVAEIPLDPTFNRTGDVWHIFVYGLGPEVLYGYRVYGPWAPERAAGSWSTGTPACWRKSCASCTVPFHRRQKSAEPLA